MKQPSGTAAGGCTELAAISQGTVAFAYRSPSRRALKGLPGFYSRRHRAARGVAPELDTFCESTSGQRSLSRWSAGFWKFVWKPKSEA
jgi:hypothetical protein